MREPPKKPIIATVEGYAVAGSMELRSSCDLNVARLPKCMPYHLAMELALTGDMWPAEKLHHYGVVNRIVQPSQALETALEPAKHLLENGPTESKDHDEGLQAFAEKRKPVWTVH